jgi:hypothetical protein
MAHLPLDDLDFSAARLTSVGENVESKSDGGERVSQFVAQHCQKIVFGPRGQSNRFCGSFLFRLQSTIFDQIGSLPREQIHNKKFWLLGPMPRPKVGRDHSEEVAAASDQGSGLYRSDSGSAQHAAY